jgi:putative membrane protein
MKLKTYTWIPIAGAVLVILFTASMGFGMMGGIPMTGWGMHGRGGGYGGFPGVMMGGVWSFFVWRIVMWIVILGIIGVIIWLVVRAQKQHGAGSAPQGETPLDIVMRRYAKGEISREEFENLKRDLQ